MAARRRAERQGFVQDRAPARAAPVVEPLSLETHARIRELCAKYDVDPTLPPNRIALILCRTMGRLKREELDAKKLRGRRSAAWATLAGFVVNRVTPREALGAADILGLGIKAALAQVMGKVDRGEVPRPEGWPEREAGQDDAEVAETGQEG